MKPRGDKWEEYYRVTSTTNRCSTFDDLCTGRLLDHLYFGLAAEVGEVMALRQKAARDRTDMDKGQLLDELGDVLWYLTELSLVNEWTLEDVRDNNIKKLEKRYGGKSN